MKEVSIGSEEMTGAIRYPRRSATEASEPGSWIGSLKSFPSSSAVVGTIGGGCLNRFGGTDPGSADGEELLVGAGETRRNVYLPLAMRFGFSLVPSLLLLLGLVSLSFACS